jgi:hypothetical protein
VSEPTLETLRTLLLERAVERFGFRPRNLVDEDGDVRLADSPFGVFARLLPRRDGDGSHLDILVVPLVVFTPSPEADAAVRAVIGDRPVHHVFGNGTLHLFVPVPPSDLASAEAFRGHVERAIGLGHEVLAAVQPRHGGLTPEQNRVLGGWRGVSDEIEGILRTVAAGTGGELLTHGWDPRRESVPLLCFEDWSGWAWASRFVTLESDGGLRLRSTVPGERDGARGFTLTVHRLAPPAARDWAARLGVKGAGPRLEPGDLRSLAGRPWSELWQAMEGLPRETGDGWQVVA